MSRTFRRKNVNISRQNHGKKVALEYTQVKFNRETWEREYRKPTKKERWRTEKYLHGESSSKSDYSPAWWHRLRRMKQNRSINKQELHKWVMIEEYEPLFEEEPRSCLWDWR